MADWQAQLITPHGHALYQRAALTQSILEEVQATGLAPDMAMAVVLGRFDHRLAELRERRDAAYPIIAATMTPDVEREALDMAGQVINAFGGEYV